MTGKVRFDAGKVKQPGGSLSGYDERPEYHTAALSRRGPSNQTPSRSRRASQQPLPGYGCWRDSAVSVTIRARRERGGGWMARDTDEVASSGNFGATLLFCCVGCFYWITLTPFVDTSVNPALAKPALWSQLLAYMLFLIVVVYAMTPRVRSVIFQPRLLLALVFGWLFRRRHCRSTRSGPCGAF